MLKRKQTKTMSEKLQIWIRQENPHDMPLNLAHSLVTGILEPELFSANARP